MSLKSFFISGLIVSMFSAFSFGATMVNGISVLVNDEPITLYEVHKISKQMNISLKESLDLLIQKRLETSQAKKLGISASDYEVNKEIEAIAKKNGISTYELKQVLASKGMSFSHYKSEIKEGVKTNKLYQRIFNNQNADVSEQEIRTYYKLNPEHFILTDEFHVITYRADTKLALQEIQVGPMRVAQGVSLSKEILKNSMINRKVAYFLEQTEIGKFTPIVTDTDGYVIYLVEEKVGTTKVSLEEARATIVTELQKEKQRMAVKNYFDKLRADASIVVVRKP